MEKYICKCVDSILNQEYQNIELILINDGSTDKSPLIIEDYASRDTRIITIHKENGGIGSAYKAALKVMTGDYVLFVDSDDWLELNAVEELVTLAQKNKADIVYFGSRVLNENGEVIQALNLNNTEGILLENNPILKRHFEEIRHPSLCRVFNKSLFQDIVVFEQNIGIDEMLTPQLLKNCQRAVYTSKIFYNVFFYTNSVSRSSYSIKTIQDTLKVYRFLMSYMERNMKSYEKVVAEKYRTVLVSFYFILIKQLQEKGTKEIIRECKIDFVQVNKILKKSFNTKADFLIAMIILFLPLKLSSFFYNLKKEYSF